MAWCVSVRYQNHWLIPASFYYFLFCIDICTKCSYNALIRNGTVIHFVLCGVIFIFWINLVKKKKIIVIAFRLFAAIIFLCMWRMMSKDTAHRSLIIRRLHPCMHCCIFVCMYQLYSNTLYSLIWTGSPEVSTSNREASVELIKLDISRTFPQLCIFQKVMFSIKRTSNLCSCLFILDILLSFRLSIFISMKWECF